MPRQRAYQGTAAAHTVAHMLQAQTHHRAPYVMLALERARTPLKLGARALRALIATTTAPASRARAVPFKPTLPLTHGTPTTTTRARLETAPTAVTTPRDTLTPHSTRATRARLGLSCTSIGRQEAVDTAVEKAATRPPSTADTRLTATARRKAARERLAQPYMGS